MYNNYLPIESIQERDIDLLLLEEFNCNEDFIQWFVLINNLPLLKKLDVKTYPFSDSSKLNNSFFFIGSRPNENSLYT